MKTYMLYDAEYLLVSLVWETEPADLSDLVWSCFIRFGWKKSITNSAIRRLCKRGILRNEDSVLTALVQKEHVQKYVCKSQPEKSNDSPRPKFIAFFLRNPRVKNILNYKKPYLWLVLGLVVSSIVCVSILIKNYYDNKEYEMLYSTSFVYELSDNEMKAITNQLADIVPPDNLSADGLGSWGDETGISGININYTVYTYDDSKPHDVFEIVQTDLDYFAEIAATIYSRIDGSYSLSFNIEGYEHAASVMYTKDTVTNELQEEIVIHSKYPVNNEYTTESTYTVEVASGETITISHGW